MVIKWGGHRERERERNFSFVSLMALLRMVFEREEEVGWDRRNFLDWVSRKSAFKKPFSTFWSRFEFDSKKSRVARSGDFSFLGEFGFEGDFRGLSLGVVVLFLTGE